MTTSTSSFTPSSKKHGFVIKSVINCEMNDYLEAVASIVGTENIQNFGRIKSNFGVRVRNDEAAAKLHELELIEVKSESLEIWPFVRQIIKVKLFGVPPFILD